MHRIDLDLCIASYWILVLSSSISENGVLEMAEDDYEGFIQRVLAKVKEMLRKQVNSSIS